MKLLFGLIAIAAMAADPAGFGQYTAKQLDDKAVELHGKAKGGLATEKLGDWGNHYVQAVHRDASGQAEFHENQADVIMIRKGEGSIIVGGTVVRGKETAPGEIRGDKIEGGEIHALKPGDVLHIAPKTPHQMILKKGQKIDYLALKIDAK
jgi:mannose-6-phosphate isomerase-like protein (cupin superfamily)